MVVWMGWFGWCVWMIVVGCMVVVTGWMVGGGGIVVPVMMLWGEWFV